MNGVDARVNFRCIFEGFGKIVRHYNRQEKKGTERQNPLSFFNSCSCERRNSAENSAGKSKICVIFNFLTQDFFVHKFKKERECKRFFCYSLPHFFIHYSYNSPSIIIL